jgi:isoleucyl-tRNA synthetase
MDEVPDGISFPAEEEKVMSFWKDIDAFQTSLKLSEGKPEYNFYDGPPFATGTPHYGHILAGTIKDVVTRYAHQTGHHVERRFGWDCHGLPVEHEIDKKLGITGKDDVMKMGIPAYNAQCRSIVTRYCKEWEETIGRMGRWIDFKNDYKTMEPWYMESVWWVFKTIYEKDLVYRGFKVMPYSTACNTPISNFEAGQNYKDVSDPAVIVSFPCKDAPSKGLAEGTAFLAWTTTPWTLPSNLALCVHPEMEYVNIKDVATGALWVVAKGRLPSLYPKMSKKGFKPADQVMRKRRRGEEMTGEPVCARVCPCVPVCTAYSVQCTVYSGGWCCDCEVRRARHVV